MPLLLILAGAAWGQPVWEDVSPLPGQEVVGLSDIIDDEAGLWVSACTYPGGYCYFYEYGTRPYYSSDRGDTWELRDNGIPSGAVVGRIHSNPVNPDILLANIINPPFGNPYRSTDRGLSWYEVAEGIPQDTMGWWCQVQWFPDGQHAYCIMSNSLSPDRYFVSEDTGQTWEYSEIRYFDYVSGIVSPYVPGMVVFTDATQGHFLSTDYGRTWQRFPSYDYIAAECFGGVGEDAATFYATGMVWRGSQQPVLNFVVISHDTCRSFHMLNPSDTLRWSTEWDLSNVMVKDPRHPGHLFFVRYDTLFESTDNGQTWQALWGGADSSHHFREVGYDPDHDIIYLVAMNYPLMSRHPALWRLCRGAGTDPREPRRTNGQATLLFPNPATSGVVLSVPWPNDPVRSVVLYNLLGQEIHRFQLPPGKSGNALTLPMPQHLPSGTYFVQINTTAHTQGLRLIINQ